MQSKRAGMWRGQFCKSEVSLLPVGSEGGVLKGDTFCAKFTNAALVTSECGKIQQAWRALTCLGSRWPGVESTFERWNNVLRLHHSEVEQIRSRGWVSVTLILRTDVRHDLLGDSSNKQNFIRFTIPSASFFTALSVETWSTDSRVLMWLAMCHSGTLQVLHNFSAVSEDFLFARGNCYFCVVF